MDLKKPVREIRVVCVGGNSEFKIVIYKFLIT